MLVSANADLHCTNPAGFTVVHYAAQKGHTQLLEFFQRRHMPLDGIDKHGRTALLWAVYNGQQRTTSWLLQQVRREHTIWVALPPLHNPREQLVGGVVARGGWRGSAPSQGAEGVTGRGATGGRAGRSRCTAHPPCAQRPCVWR